MNITQVALNQLVPSPHNVRKTGALDGIEELAASIEAHGLLQNLQVRRAEKNRFEVVAGGRRLAAMHILRRQKKLAKDFPVPCHVLDGENAVEVSLAENAVRLAMHPADQFTAFQALTVEGMGAEDIAARFGITPTVVRQRLKLGSVSPALIDAYRAGEMSLDQLMAFTVSDDPKAQEAAWADLPEFRRHPHAIRAALTAAQVEADDRRVRFVGLDAYLTAGGGLNRDLFQEEHEGYLTDPALLDRLVAEKLAQIANEVRCEGWAWVEIMPLANHAALSAFRRVRPLRQSLDEETQARLDQLVAEYDALADEQGHDPDQEGSERLDALSALIEEVERQAYVWRPDDIAHAGAVISVDYDGEPNIERGLVRPEDARRLRAVENDHGSDEQGPKTPGLSAALVESLTAERTAALRALMINQRTTALASLAHALALPLFYAFGVADMSSLQLRLTSRDLVRSAPTVETSRAGKLIAERRAAWEARLPAGAEDLFGWLLTQERETVLDLLAFCAAESVDAVRCKADHPNQPRLAHADALASALGLDMRQWWEPTGANYLGRVSKALALEAVREGLSPQAAENLATLKKDQLIEAAERRLAGQGWLPAILQTQEAAEPEGEAEAKTAA